MKKGGLVLLILLGSIASFGQRHYKGQKGIEIGGGVTKYGNFYQGGFVLFTGTRFYGKSLLYYETGKGPSSAYNYRDFGMTITGNYTILPPFRERYFLNAVFGVVASKDGLQNPLALQDQNGNVYKSDLGQFKYGVLGGVELEAFISDRFVFTLGWNSRYVLPNTQWGSVRWYGNVGVRYNF